MRALLAALVVALSAPALAGCITPDVQVTVDSQVTVVPGDLAFTPLKVIDSVRPGGEPVIAITPKGTLVVSAHPGETHNRGVPSPGLVSNFAAQSYIWTSVDNGETFVPVSPIGPQGPWLGVSDPDFAVDSNGRIYGTDLGPLTHAAVMWSDDEGRTWNANAVASGPGPIDRQWLATVGTDVYLVANYFTEQRVMKSTDGGLTWNRVGRANCNGDIISDAAGVLYIGCSQGGVDVSEDGGKTWERRLVPETTPRYRTMAEPAIDAAGNVYVTWTEENAVYYAASADKGKTWTHREELGNHTVPGMTAIWPWIVAGDEGRIAVAWFGQPEGEAPGVAKGEWHVYLAVVSDAHTRTPTVTAAKATSEPLHVGPICQNGTVCQLPAGPTAGDRRLGDFFEIAVDHAGFVHMVFSVTTAGDSIAHPGYVRQVAGPRLYAEPRPLMT